MLQVKGVRGARRVQNRAIQPIQGGQESLPKEVTSELRTHGQVGVTRRIGSVLGLGNVSGREGRAHMAR